MIVVNSNNSGLTEAYYSGTSLTEIYMGQHLIWPVPPTPVGDYKLRYAINDSEYEIQCDSSSNLTQLEISNHIIHNVGDYTTSSITQATVGSCVTSLANNCFNADWSLTSVTMPNSVTSIGYSTFKNCSAMTTCVLSNSITSIPLGLFENDYELTGITIPNSVTSIGEDAFYDCLSLDNIVIPSNVTSIDNNAFRCSWWEDAPATHDRYVKMMHIVSGRSITCLATTPPTLGNGVFGIISGQGDVATYPIYVPSASVDAYKSATNWSTYADRIQAIQ